MTFRAKAKHRQTANLEEAVRQLEDLAASTEGEFLRLGEALQRLCVRSREIAAWSATITDRMNGPELNQAMEELQTILSAVRALDTGSREAAEHLRAILTGIEGIQGAIHTFGKMVRNLPALCSFIKIESVRLESNRESFSTLSEDVRNLAGRIEEKSSQFLDRATGLSILLRRHLDTIERFSAGQHGQALAILDDANRCLEAMTARHALSTSAMREITDRWERIGRGIGEVVASLQFHDITRQRIEHAHTALGELAARPAALPAVPPVWIARLFSRGGAAGSCRTPSLLATLQGYEIQQAQLDHARGEAVDAVRRILATLGEITGHIDEIGDRTGALIEVDHNGDSFLTTLEKGFATLGSSMEAYHRLQAQVHAMIDEAAETIGALSGFIKEIRMIGIEIRMIALNAAVRAAHAGESGLALGVLAESIQQLAGDTARQTDIISNNLAAVVSSAQELTRRIRQQQNDRDRDPDQLGREISAILASLQRIDGETAAILGRIKEQGRCLAADIAALSAEIGVHERFEREIREVNAILEQFAQDLRRRIPEGERSSPPAVLEHLDRRYTMNSERAIHEAVLGGVHLSAAAVSAAALTPLATADPTPAPAGEADANASEFGDNVELF